MPVADASMSALLHLRAKLRNQPRLAKAKPGRTFSGEFRLNNVFMVPHRAPGTASGSTWLGHT